MGVPTTSRRRPDRRPASRQVHVGVRRLDLARPVRDVLRSALLRGVFAVRGLPDEAALAAEFSTSRNVIREALGMLRDEGLVQRTQGIGTFPAAYLEVARGHRIDAVVDAAAGGADHVALELLRAEVQEAPTFVAARLGLPARSPVLLAERLGRIDGEPAMLTLGYLPASRAVPTLVEPGVSQWWPHIGVIEELLGTTLRETEVTFDSVAADIGIAATLKCPVGHPLLLLERLMLDDAGLPIQLSVMRCRGLRVSFE